MGPRYALDASARLPALPAIEQDALVAGGQMFQHPGLRVHPQPRPLLPVCVKAARGEHQQRRPGTHHFVMRHDAIDIGYGHWSEDNTTSLEQRCNAKLAIDSSPIERRENHWNMCSQP